WHPTSSNEETPRSSSGFGNDAAVTRGSAYTLDNPQILMFPPAGMTEGDDRSPGLPVNLTNHKIRSTNRHAVLGGIKVKLLTAGLEPETIGRDVVGSNPLVGTALQSMSRENEVSGHAQGPVESPQPPAERPGRHV